MTSHQHMCMLLTFSSSFVSWNVKYCNSQSSWQTKICKLTKKWKDNMITAVSWQKSTACKSESVRQLHHPATQQQFWYLEGLTTQPFVIFGASRTVNSSNTVTVTRSKSSQEITFTVIHLTRRGNILQICHISLLEWEADLCIINAFLHSSPPK